MPAPFYANQRLGQPSSNKIKTSVKNDVTKGLWTQSPLRVVLMMIFCIFSFTSKGESRNDLFWEKVKRKRKDFGYHFF